MKDYEDYMKEEEKQDRLQDELEYQRREEAYESDINWLRWQAEQKRKEYEEACYEDPFAGWPELDYEDDDCYYPKCEDDYDIDDMELAYDPYGDLLDADIPCENDTYSPTAEELYDMYAYADSLEDFSGHELDMEDSTEDELVSENMLFEVDFEEVRINKKSVAKNRHHASERAKKKSKRTAEILEAKFYRLYAELTSRKEANYFRLHFTAKDAFIEGEYLRPNELRRLYYSEKSATKKSARIKSKTA